MTACMAAVAVVADACAGSAADTTVADAASETLAVNPEEVDSAIVTPVV